MFQDFGLLKTTGDFLLSTTGLPITLRPTASIVKGIVADYGALDRTITPNPATNLGGTRLYSTQGLQGLPAYAVARMNFASAKVTFNFGGTAFAQSVPAGFSAWGAATVLTIQNGGITLSGGNLTAQTFSGSFDTVVRSTTSKTTGKWYFEVTIVTLGSPSGPDIGLWNLVSPLTGDASDPNDPAVNGNSVLCLQPDGSVWYGPPGFGSDQRDLLGSAFSAADVISVAIDFDHSRIWYRRNAGPWACHGTTQAFEEFKAFGQAQTQQVLLNIEPGSYFLVSFDAKRPLAGIPKIAVWGYGASLYIPNDNYLIELGSHSGYWGGGPFPYPNGPTGETLALRLLPANPGDRWVDVPSPVFSGSFNLFPAGVWCSLDSQELQGHAGYPPNEYNCEYVQIDHTEGQRIFLKSSVRGTYVIGLPERYSPGDTDGYDPGGPATLHRMFKSGGITPDNAWDAEIQILGLTLDGTTASGSNALNASARDVRLVDTTFINLSPNISVTKKFQILRGTIDAFLEVDKDVETVEIDGVRFNSNSLVQSASIQYMTVKNSTWAAPKFLQGTAKVMEVDNCVMPGGMIMGCIGYGQTKSITISNSNIGAVGNPDNFVALSDLTYSNGVFSTSVDGVVPVAVPGLAYYGGHGRPFALAFNVSEVIASADNRTLIVTDLPYPSALPTLPPIFAEAWLVWHPCESMHVSSSVGCLEIVELCDAYAQGRPLHSYGKRTMVGHLINQTLPNWGRLISISINVTVPYVGPLPSPVFGIFLSAIDNSFSMLSSPVASINVKIAGERIITPTSITGAQTGDVFPPSLPIPITLIEGPSYSVNLTGDVGNPTPTVILTAKTDQLSQFS